MDLRSVLSLPGEKKVGWFFYTPVVKKEQLMETMLLYFSFYEPMKQIRHYYNVRRLIHINFVSLLFYKRKTKKMYDPRNFRPNGNEKKS